MENIKTCPLHTGRELKEFTAGLKAKKPGMVYHKCTFKDESGQFCQYVQWPEDDFSYTKKFTQLPNGQVYEEEATWMTNIERPISSKTAPGSEESPASDLRAMLTDIVDRLSVLDAKINSLRKLTISESKSEI